MCCEDIDAIERAAAREVLACEDEVDRLREQLELYRNTDQARQREQELSRLGQRAVNAMLDQLGLRGVVDDWRRRRAYAPDGYDPDAWPELALRVTSGDSLASVGYLRQDRRTT